MQEGFLFHYLHLFLKDVEEMGENRIMPILRSLGIFMNLVHAIMILRKGLSETLVEKALETLSFIVQCEDFATYREEYMGDGNIGFNLEAITELQKQVLKPAMKEVSLEKKKILKPLNDAVDKTKRLFSRPKK